MPPTLVFVASSVHSNTGPFLNTAITVQARDGPLLMVVAGEFVKLGEISD